MNAAALIVAAVVVVLLLAADIRHALHRERTAHSRICGDGSRGNCEQ